MTVTHISQPLRTLAQRLLAGKVGAYSEYVRFVIVGVINTLVDFAVLNSLLFALGSYGASHFSVIKGGSFLAAVVGSYFLNKFWVFGSQKAGRETIKARGADRLAEGGKFFAVSVAGFIINVVASAAVFTLFQRSGFPHDQIAANIGALTGTLVVLAWNFVGYKFFVFKPRAAQTAQNA